MIGSFATKALASAISCFALALFLLPSFFSAAYTAAIAALNSSIRYVIITSNNELTRLYLFLDSVTSNFTAAPMELFLNGLGKSFGALE